MRAFGCGSASTLLLSLRQFRHAAALVSGSLDATERQPLVGRNQERSWDSLERREENGKAPAPIVADVSQFWEGNDGPWSSFVLQIGNSSQEVRVLPSTASSTTWVVYADPGCNDVPVTDCPASRGKTFQRGLSRTWTPVSIGQNAFFELGLEENLLGREVYGEFGWDIVSLGWANSAGPTVEHSLVAGIGDTHFTWLGVLGLNPRPTNFTNLPNDPQTSFIQALKNQGDIPSLSWSYTAGAPYRLNSVFGSLVLGGYDQARFTRPAETDSNLNFPFYTDISRDLLVGISSISTSKTTSSASETTLLNDGIFAFVDSTVPHIWLPESVCKAFEDAFGLKWNSTIELYTLTEEQHSNLLKLDPSITFNLSPTLPPTAAERSVAITLPYSAFDLNVSWPYGGGQFSNESTYYFPLKRAMNDTQYTLGRTFLQEAYLIADYERQNFSIWPTKWDVATTNSQIVSIVPLEPITDTNQRNLSTGAIVGIAVGGFAAAAIIGLMIFFYIQRRRRARNESVELQRAQTDTSGGSLPSYHPHLARSSTEQVTELAGAEKHELHEDHRIEAPEGGKFEMDGNSLPHEAGGTEKPGLYEMDAGGDGIGGMHGVSITVEPPTALSPRPASIMPSPVSEDSALDSVANEKLEKTEPHTEVTRIDSEKDGVRSFFGFLKAFRRSGKS